MLLHICFVLLQTSRILLFIHCSITRCVCTCFETLRVQDKMELRAICFSFGHWKQAKEVGKVKSAVKWDGDVWLRVKYRDFGSGPKNVTQLTAFWWFFFATAGHLLVINRDLNYILCSRALEQTVFLFRFRAY